jgi:hypothetical protein
MCRYLISLCFYFFCGLFPAATMAQFADFDSTICINTGAADVQICTDTTGNIYMLYSFKDSTRIGLFTCTTYNHTSTAADRGLCLVKMNRMKEVLWMYKIFEDTNIGFAKISCNGSTIMVIVDALGTTILGEAAGDTVLVNKELDAYSLCFNGLGQRISWQVASTDRYDGYSAIKSNANGEYIVIGSFNGTNASPIPINNSVLVLGNDTLHAYKYNCGMLIKFDSIGQIIKAVACSDSDANTLLKLSIYGTDIYVVGSKSSDRAVRIGNCNYPVPATADPTYAFVLKLDDQLNGQWCRFFNHCYWGSLGSVTGLLASNSTLYMGFSVFGTTPPPKICFDDGSTITGIGGGTTDYFIVGLNALSGNIKWKKTSQGYNDEGILEMTSNKNDGCVVLSDFTSSIYVDSVYVNNTAGSSFFVHCYDSAGKLQYIAAPNKASYPLNIHYNKAINRTIIVGYLYDNGLFGTDTIRGPVVPGASNLFITEIDSNLTFTTATNAPLQIANNITIYPNPVQEQLYVQNLPAAEKTNYRIVNNLGVVAQEGMLKPYEFINVKALPLGTYILSLTTEQNNQNIKFIK